VLDMVVPTPLCSEQVILQVLNREVRRCTRTGTVL
jgi:hypothetical protein